MFLRAMRRVKYGSFDNLVIFFFLCIRIVTVPVRGLLESTQVVDARNNDELLFVVFMGFHFLIL